MKKSGVAMVFLAILFFIFRSRLGVPISIMMSLFISFALLYFVIWLILKLIRSPKVVEEEMPTLTKEREDYYIQLGMSPSEIDLFRDTMNNAKKQIMRIQNNIGQSSKLKAIDLRHDTLKAAKALFKGLVKEPTRLHDASHFLYTHLPNMADLTQKYIEINDHEIKSKETFAKLEESTQIIDQLAILIVQDYQKFVSEDLEDLDVEISIAKQSLKRDNELKGEFK